MIQFRVYKLSSGQMLDPGAVSKVGDSPSPSSLSKLPHSELVTLTELLVPVAANKSLSLVCEPPILLGPLPPNKYESSERDEDISPS